MFSDLSVQIKSLAVFRRLRENSVFSALEHLIYSIDNLDTAIDCYSNFVFELHNAGETNLSKFIRDLVNNDENIYIRTIGKGDEVSSSLKNDVSNELAILQRIANLTPSDFHKMLKFNGYLPSFDNSKIDIAQQYKDRVCNISRYGYGIYAKYHMFCIDENNCIVPVRYPDPVKLSDLSGYKREKKIIIDNTRLLLENKPSANILLTGDAGTGKSSTVKAVVNELKEDGLRILQVRKDQLHAIPAILDELTVNPLKFIIFIDDLSFGKDEDNYSALKAILEGSVSAKSHNVVIYATSNRRHLVRESFSDRDGDDIHFNDTVQEVISLSERFGIHITFNRPNKTAYLDIVHNLLDSANVEYDVTKVDIEAESFALTRGNRSARAAKQFADSYIAKSL